MLEKTLFDEIHDVLVVVDDWKGTEPGKEDSPVSFTGRSFVRTDVAKLESLLQILEKNKAHKWHGKKRKSKNSSLLTCPDFELIVKGLEDLNSVLFESLFSVKDFIQKFEEWRELLSRAHESIRSFWKEDDPYACGLFRFIFVILSFYNIQYQTNKKPISIRVIVDRIDWIYEDQRFKEDTLVELPFGELKDPNFTCSAAATNLKEDPTIQGFLPWLGLVDSESWAVARVQSVKLDNGQTIRELLLDWQARGSPKEEIVINESLFKQALQRSLKGPFHETVELYLEHWMKWHGNDRAILLNNQEPPRNVSAAMP